MSDSFTEKYFKPFIIGSMSGCVASSVIQPIDTTKVVIQNKREHAGRTKIDLNPFKIAKEIVADSGVAGKPNLKLRPVQGTGFFHYETVHLLWNATRYLQGS
jgi:hypothetical protein